MIVGTVKYLSCAGLQPPGVPHTCNVNGPGVVSRGSFPASLFSEEFLFFMTMGEFLGKVFLTYCGFWFLNHSVSLGGKIFMDGRLVGATITIKCGGTDSKKKKKKVEITSYNEVSERSGGGAVTEV